MRSRYLTAAVALLAFIVMSPLAGAETLRLATTTSTVASGLLDNILPAFEKTTGIEVHVIAVGTGKALRMGSDGDVDVVLVHAPAAEERFVVEGNGVNRRSVMYNEFLIVGPESDPAGIRGSQDAADALTKISQTGARFVSRGDDSGTHKKELSLWRDAGQTPDGASYLEAGQGMGKVLQMASELDAYTLVDEGTWLNQGSGTRLAVLSRGDERLFNPYGIIAVNPERHPHVNHAAAQQLTHWITGIEGQRLIGQYRVDGKQLFTPSASSIAGTI